MCYTTIHEVLYTYPKEGKLRKLSLAFCVGLVCLAFGVTTANTTIGAQNVPYGPMASDLLDVYPASHPDRPVVVVLHGGGWVSGDKTDAHPVKACVNVQALDMTCLSVNYSLGANNPWPTQLPEMTNLRDWINTNASSYNGNPNKVVFWGLSAGGQIGLEAAYRLPNVTAVISWSGPTDLLTWKHFAPVYCSNNTTTCLSKRYDASPVNFVNATSPPTYIAHSVKDGTVPFSQSIELDNVLTTNGISHQFLQLAGNLHAGSMWNGAWPSTKAWLIQVTN